MTGPHNQQNTASRTAPDALHDKAVQTIGLRAFFALADKWRLKPADAMALLGDPKDRTYYNWKQGRIG